MEWCTNKLFEWVMCRSIWSTAEMKKNLVQWNNIVFEWGNKPTGIYSNEAYVELLQKIM